MLRDSEAPALCMPLLAIMTDFGVAPLASGGQIVIYIVQPVLSPDGGLMEECKIQQHQILNTSLRSVACLVGQSGRPASARRK